MPFYPELSDYCQLGWSSDLKKYGLTVSVWIKPSEWDFKKCLPKNDNALAYLYKHTDGSVYIAKKYADQVKVHEKYGIPIDGPGEEFSDGNKQLSLF